ncbi:unnamed protein product [Absidia cylindrospora]
MHSEHQDHGLKNLWQHHNITGSLPPEVDHQGNIEYKFKLVEPSEVRMEQLITQLKWRLAEGDGQALYELGVNDDGTLTGLSDQDMSTTLDTLRRMAEALNAEVTIVREVKINNSIEGVDIRKYNKMHGIKDENGDILDEGYTVAALRQRCVIEALVRQRTPIDLPTYTDIRMAIVGDTGSGKSTFLAHISHGIKDTGHGTARISLLRHPHEIETGNTSCIAHEMIGYTRDGVLVNSATSSSGDDNDTGAGASDDGDVFLYGDNDDLETSSWEQICASSSKVVTFLDTCGHTKYLRTTISALTGYAPDYAMLVVPATLGSNVITNMTREHVSLVFMLDVPLCVVVTKIDLATNDQIQRCVQSLQTFLSSISGVRNQHRRPVVMSPSASNRTDDNSKYDGQQQQKQHSTTTNTNTNTNVTDIAASMIDDTSTIPIFLVSNVTGAHMNLVHQYLNALPKPTVNNTISLSVPPSHRSLLEEPAEFQVEQVYTLPHVGIVVGGVLRQGRININDPESQRTFALGPNSQGDFIQATVISIHRHRMPSHYVHYSQTASLAIRLSPLSANVDDQQQQSSSQHYHHHAWGKIKKGMVLLATDNTHHAPPPESYTTFEANVLVLHHATGLRQGTCGMLRSGFIRQQARVVAIHQEQSATQDEYEPSASTTTTTTTTSTTDAVLKSGQQGICVFQFLGDPEYLRLDTQFLFMEGTFKCLGSVTRLVDKINGKWIH